MTELDPATVLEEAADLLLIRGVMQNGSWGSIGGARCTVGAICEVVGADDALKILYEHPAVAAVAAHLGLVGADEAPGWNDNADDPFEVIDTLRLVAKDLRNGGSDSDGGG